MEKVFSLVLGFTDNLTRLLLSLVSVAVLVEVLFSGSGGVFGVSVVSNITSIVSKLGTQGFAGLMAVLVLLALFNKK